MVLLMCAWGDRLGTSKQGNVLRKKIRMPITAIHLENFKGIREKVEIPLRPVTLLFGGNSAGKSTILHALFYLREVLNTGTYDHDFVAGGGEVIELGGFDQIVHHGQQVISITVDYLIDDDGLPEIPEFGVMEIQELAGKTLSYTLRFSLQQVEVSVSYENTVFCKLEQNMRSTLFLASVISELPEDIQEFTGLGQEDWQLEINSMFEAGLEGDRGLEELEAYKGLTEVLLPLERKDHEAFSLHEWSVSDFAHLPSAGEWFGSMIVGPLRLVQKNLERLCYIGPARVIPGMDFSMRRRIEKEDNWADGSAAWHYLYTEFFSPDLDGNLPEVTEKINEVMRVLGMGYMFFKQPHYKLPAEFDFKAGDPFEPGSASDLQGILEEMKALNKAQGYIHWDLVLMDKITEQAVLPKQVGTGVSQVVPVLVAAIKPKIDLLAIEQPELHLHPQMQCNLADVFAHSVHQYPDRINLIETHSEHFLLRFLKRIREHSEEDGETVEGFPLPDAFPLLTPDKLSVLAITKDPNIGITEVKKMRISDEGGILGRWPGGFFEERAGELF